MLVVYLKSKSRMFLIRLLSHSRYPVLEIIIDIEHTPRALGDESALAIRDAGDGVSLCSPTGLQVGVKSQGKSSISSWAPSQPTATTVYG